MVVLILDGRRVLTTPPAIPVSLLVDRGPLRGRTGRVRAGRAAAAGVAQFQVLARSLGGEHVVEQAAVGLRLENLVKHHGRFLRWGAPASGPLPPGRSWSILDGRSAGRSQRTAAGSHSAAAARRGCSPAPASIPASAAASGPAGQARSRRR